MKIIMLSLCLILISLSLFSCSKKDDLLCIDPDRVGQNVICTLEYAPVCGCNGKTYGNECEAGSAGVLSWTDGECN